MHIVVDTVSTSSYTRNPGKTIRIEGITMPYANRVNQGIARGLQCQSSIIVAELVRVLKGGGGRLLRDKQQKLHISFDTNTCKNTLRTKVDQRVAPSNQVMSIAQLT